jgi:hypothetical protein
VAIAPLYHFYRDRTDVFTHLLHSYLYTMRISDGISFIQILGIVHLPLFPVIKKKEKFEE